MPITVMNDRHLVWNVMKSVCSECKHMNRGDFSCPAFKDIPDALLKGELKHNKLIPGQIGKTVFEQR